jgi:hypothetical protein
MHQLFLRLWEDDRGALIATEWVFMATILVLGALVGLVAVRQALVSELTEFGNGVLALNQSFSFAGQSNCLSSIAGSRAFDTCDSIPAFSTAPECTSFIGQPPCL